MSAIPGALVSAYRGVMRRPRRSLGAPFAAIGHSVARRQSLRNRDRLTVGPEFEHAVRAIGRQALEERQRDVVDGDPARRAALGLPSMGVSVKDG